MNLRSIVALTFASLVASGANAELPSLSVSNYLRYGEGEEIQNTRDSYKKYFEEMLSFNIHWGNFLAGGRYEHDDPSEFGLDHRTMRKWFLEYRRGPWKVRGGTFAALFSRGMVMNAYEEDTIGHDSEITGVNVLYETGGTTVNLLAGKLDYEKIPDFENIVEYDIRGGSVRRRIFEWCDFGGSYMRGDVSQERGFYKIADGFYAHAAEIWSEFTTDMFQVHAVMASNDLTGDKLFVSGRNSIYASFSGTLPSTAMTLEYKNYKFGVTTPDNRDDDLRHRRMLAFQNPPTAIKEFSWTLLSRRTHNVNFNDEVGAQLDVYHSLSPETTLNFNAAVAGRQYRYERTRNYRFVRRDDSMTWLPSLAREHSPFWQTYCEAERYFPGGSSVVFGLSYTYEEIYNYYYPDLREQTRAFIAPIRMLWQLPRSYSLEGTVELQKFKETLHGDTYHSNNHFILGFGKAPFLSASLEAEYMSENYNYDDQTIWLNGSIRYRYHSSQIFEVGYGETRGGLVCTNGQCRYVPEYKGWRFFTETHW